MAAGWSPALFKHLHAHGFDVLTWRKGPAQDLPAEAFTDLDFTDETGREHTWRAADTIVTLALPRPKNTSKNTRKDTSKETTWPADGGGPSRDDALVGVRTGPDGEPLFAMRQVTLAVPATRHAKRHAAGATTESGTSESGNSESDDGTGESDEPARRQIHILTTRTDLPAAEVIYRMGSRWGQENYFRYARMHFELDAHDSYAAGADDPDRLVPNPAKKHAHQQVLTARARYERQAAAADAALLQARSPKPGAPVVITNAEHDKLTAAVRTAEAALTAAEAAHAAIPKRLPLAQVNPGQQVLETQTKLLTHAIRIAAFNTASTLGRELRLHTGYARKNHEAHTLIRQALTWTGDIDPTTDGVLTIRLDPLPTAQHRPRAALPAPDLHPDTLPRHQPDPALRDENDALILHPLWPYVRSPGVVRAGEG